MGESNEVVIIGKNSQALVMGLVTVALSAVVLTAHGLERSQVGLSQGPASNGIERSLLEVPGELQLNSLMEVPARSSMLDVPLRAKFSSMSEDLQPSVSPVEQRSSMLEKIAQQRSSIFKKFNVLRSLLEVPLKSSMLEEPKG